MCPDENELTLFARGGTSNPSSLEAHLDGCDDCRRVVAAAASDRTLPGQRPTRELAPGLRVDRYEIECERGRGGMGVVYQARDLTLDRRVALKLLHARRDDQAQARLVREAQVMAKLAHPNVVHAFELGEWRGDLYLAMELIDGVTLEEWLKRSKHSSAEIISHFLQAGSGLAAAHAAGVVHRDFKPANVLVGSDDRVRVTDFGLSRAVPTLELPATNSPVRTQTGAILGTLTYMAPEQLEGKLADERSDQFSFCVSLAEALSGERPFGGESRSQLARSLAQKPRFGAGVSRRLRAVLRKGLAVKPADRYASMSALLAAIEETRTIGWGSVAVTGLAATLCLTLGLIQYSGEGIVRVLAVNRDVPAGTVLSDDLLESRFVRDGRHRFSTVKAKARSAMYGRILISALHEGDLLERSNIGDFGPATPNGLSNDDVTRRLMVDDRAIAKCKSLTIREGWLKVLVSISAAGVPTDVRTSSEEFADDAAAKCLLEHFATVRFPRRSTPTLEVVHVQIGADASSPQRIVQSMPENAIFVVTASEDLPEGTILTKDMLQQRAMPEGLVPPTAIAPERTKEILGQVLKTPARKGDSLLWTQFNVRVRVVTFRRDAPAGTTLSRKFLEERDVPGELAGSDVVQGLWSSYGRTLLLHRKEGELLHVGDSDSEPKKGD